MHCMSPKLFWQVILRNTEEAVPVSRIWVKGKDEEKPKNRDTATSCNSPGYRPICFLTEHWFAVTGQLFFFFLFSPGDPKLQI